MNPTRRQYLGSLAAGASLAVAGCSSSGGGGDDDERSPEDAPAVLQLDGVTLDPSTPIQLRHATSDELAAEVHGHPEFYHWHQSPLQLRVGEWTSYLVNFRDFDREPIALGDGEQFQLSVAPAGSIDFVEADVSGNRLDVRGTEAGGAELEMELLRDDEMQWTPPNLPLSIQG